MDRCNAQVVIDHSCLLGEGPLWDAREKRICWVDILKGEIQYFHPENKRQGTFNVHRMVGAIALKKSGGFIAAVKGGFASVDIDSNAFQLISEVETQLPGNRFNDGKCDPAGRFWAGTMSLSDIPHAGSLYTLEKDYTITKKIAGVSCSNGMAWSMDHKTFYYIDSPTRQVVAYTYDAATGNITDPKIVVHIPDGEGYPDGMTIDSDGMLWIALWDGWKVARYNPDSGKEIYRIDMPVSRPTSCVFGGDTLSDLYITSARDGLSERDIREQPLAGCLFVVSNCDFKGTDAFEYDG